MCMKVEKEYGTWEKPKPVEAIRWKWFFSSYYGLRSWYQSTSWKVGEWTVAKCLSTTTGRVQKRYIAGKHGFHVFRKPPHSQYDQSWSMPPVRRVRVRGLLAKGQWGIQTTETWKECKILPEPKKAKTKRRVRRG